MLRQVATPSSAAFVAAQQPHLFADLISLLFQRLPLSAWTCLPACLNPLLLAVTVQPKHLDAFIEDMVSQSNSGRSHTAFLFMAWLPGDDFVATALQSGQQVRPMPLPLRRSLVPQRWPALFPSTFHLCAL